MKKLYLALATMALAATLATGCGNKHASDVSPSEVKFEDYALPFRGCGEGRKGILEYRFDMENYLNAYGATEFQKLQSSNREVIYGIKFKNGTLLGLHFSEVPNAYGEGCELTDVIVTASKPDYVITTYDELKNAGTKKVKKLASWSREFDFSNRGGKIDRRFCRDRDIENHEPYIVDYSNSRFYGSRNKTLLLVPLDFDDTFKQTVAPYLDLKKAPLSKDPLKDGITNIRINESESCVESDVQNDESTTEDESDLINNTENTGRIISEVNFRDYAVPQYTPITATSTAQSGYAFNLGGYLDAYGLTEVSEPQFLRNDNNEIVYGVKFENGIMLGLYFYNLEALDPYYGNGSNYELTKVLVTACKPDFVFMDYDELKNAGTKKVKKLASWSREFNFHDRNGKIFEDLYTDFHLPYKIPKDSPHIHSDECDTLLVPLDFDDTFKQTVAPYLDLKKAPLSKDPFGDKN